MDKARAVADRLARDERVRLVYVFGSAADADVAEPNDLDIAVLAEPALSFDERMALRADLAVESIAGIDLVSLDDAPIVLAHEVAEHGVCLFARNPEDEVAFVTAARARFWDFAPYLAQQWAAAGERAETRRRGPQA